MIFWESVFTLYASGFLPKTEEFLERMKQQASKINITIFFKK